MPIHLASAVASVVCEKLTPQNTESLQVLFDADWQEEAGSDELPTGNRISSSRSRDDCFGFYDGVKVKLLWHKTNSR